MKRIHPLVLTLVALTAAAPALAGNNLDQWIRSASGNAVFEATNDEAGSRIVHRPFGAYAGSPSATSKPLAVGDLSGDRQWIYRGGDAGWELRPMEYRLSGGRLVHVDDPVGHMHRRADSRPATASELEALRLSGGR